VTDKPYHRTGAEILDLQPVVVPQQGVLERLKPRRYPPPVLSCDIRLDPETYGLEMTLYDADGGVVILSFGLEAKPRDFDLSRLSEAWVRWRQTSAVAS
jgi:hypothetical protein